MLGDDGVGGALEGGEEGEVGCVCVVVGEVRGRWGRRRSGDTVRTLEEEGGGREVYVGIVGEEGRGGGVILYVGMAGRRDGKGCAYE